MVYRLGLVGRDIGHSLSPTLHKAAAASADLEVSYELLDVDGSELPSIAHALRVGDFHGLNVTAPYKKWAYEICQQLDRRALRTQAVNTLRVDERGQICGSNTDWAGINTLLSDVALRRCLVLGSGRTAETVLHVLERSYKADVFVAHRNAVRFKELRDRVGLTLSEIEYAALNDAELPFDTVINCLPNHCYGLLATLPWHTLPAQSWWLDLNYGARTDAFLDHLNHGDLKRRDGVTALVAQGTASFALWTGEQPDEHFVLREVEKATSRARQR